MRRAGLALLLAAAAWAPSCRRAPAPAPADVSILAMTDSVRVAADARDWERALVWSQRLAAADTVDAEPLIFLGITLHNLASTGTAYGRERAATRTSLERIEMRVRALALLDSALRRTTTDRQFAVVMVSEAQLYETLGLPLEALQYYLAANERRPDESGILSHVVFLDRSLRDPLTDHAGQWVAVRKSAVPPAAAPR